MTGRIVRQGHTCAKPSPLSHEVGTIWECECRASWYRTAAGSWVYLPLANRILLEMADNFAAARRRGGTP